MHDPAARSTAPPPSPDTRSVLVIRQGAFGDLVQADGAMRDIRAHHPHARIALLVGPQYRPLMARCPHVDELIADPRAPLLHVGRNVLLLRELRSRRFDRVYDLQGSDRTAFYRRVMPSSGEWFRKRNTSDGQTPDRSAYADLLADAGVATPHTLCPDVGWMADDVHALLDAAGIRPGYVVLVPGSAARHQHKRWNGYGELARRLADLGRQVVAVPGPDELDLARSLPCHVLLGPAGYLDWFALAGVLRGAAFVVGNDTGPTHLAAALGTPGLALFGGHTSAARTGIRMRAFDAIEVPELEKLTVDRVMAEVSRRLSS